MKTFNRNITRNTRNQKRFESLEFKARELSMMGKLNRADIGYALRNARHVRISVNDKVALVALDLLHFENETKPRVTTISYGYNQNNELQAYFYNSLDMTQVAHPINEQDFTEIKELLKQA